jgi:small-conductance mechanosensitive channel
MEANQLIAEVARATGVRLDRSDPILAAAVVHEALLNEVLAKLDRQVTIQADRVTAASTQAVVDAKKEAETLLTDAGEWVDVRMKAAGEAAAALVLVEIRKEIVAAQAARRAMTRTAWLLVTVCLAGLSGVGGIVLANLR